MKSKIVVVFAFIGILLLVTACGGSTEASTDQHAEDEHVEDEHVEDEQMHSPDEHMAGSHNVPEEAAAVPNPFSATDDSLASGRTIYATNCAVCHGEEGRGDGPAAEGLEKKPADLNADHVQGLSDGALFYIVSHGKPDTPMPAWEEILVKAEDRWNVVNFMRTLVDEHDDGDHAEDVHVEDVHVEDEHVEDEHVEDEHVEDEHMEDEHMEDEHMEDEHSD